MGKKDVRLKGQLKSYMRWPLIMTILLIAMNLWMYQIDKNAGLLMTLFVFIYLVIVSVLYFHNRSLILADLIEFSTQYQEIQTVLLQDLAIPYAITSGDGYILWKNKCFQELLDGKDKLIQKVLPEISPGIFPSENGGRTHLEVQYKERDYQVEIRRISLEEFSEKLREEYYLEFLKRFQALASGEEDITDAIEILEGMFEDYQEILDTDLIEALEELIDDLSYLDEGDIHAKKEILNSYLETLS